MGAVIALPVAIGLTILSMRPSDFIYWFKWLVAYICLEIRRRTTKRRFDLYDMDVDNDPYKTGFLPPEEEVTLESPYPDSHLINGNDEIFIYGVNSKSEYLVTRLARGPNNEAEAWIYLKLQNGKVYHLRDCTSYQQSCSEKKAFTCGGLQLYYIAPMRRWRIFYNGLLRETSEDDPTLDRMVHVKFAVLWRASSDVFDFTSDVDTKTIAKGVANAKWGKMLPSLDKLYNTMNFYAQGGIINGTVTVDEEPDIEIYLFGERLRTLGDTQSCKGAHSIKILGHVTRNGSIVHLAEINIPHVAERARFGFIVLPDGRLFPASKIQISEENPSDNQKKDYDIKASFQADDCTFELKAKQIEELTNFSSKKGWEGTLRMESLNLHLDSVKGCGVILRKKVLKPATRSSVKISSSPIPSATSLAVPFTDKICQQSSLTGGKGSSLGKLTQLSKVYQNFIVPSGVVITTSAYEAFITRDILMEVKKLEDITYGKTEGDIKEACLKVMDEVVQANIPKQVLQAAVICLEKVFGENLQSKKFAVRSSATGEDTEQMSAAGQMETFLGISGMGQIMSAVKKCWASQFGYIAVQYKRQNGQVLNSPMAVVIQEMVPCDVAGVLFTCDPLTGNPTLMSITANYGLGEAVVSGSEEPDTIELLRDVDDNLQIKNKIIGAKNQRIVIKDQGTDVETVSENERANCCLSDAMALRLGDLAIKIEKSYRSHRDIEWGFWNNNLYMFQSRPVTTGTGETDYEIDHERDDPLRIENDYFTVCNLGEVLPGAMTPLGIEVTMKFFNIVFQRKSFVGMQSSVRSKYFPKKFTTMYNHWMFYAIDFLELINEGKAVLDAYLIGFFGRILDDEEMFDIARERYGRKKKQSFFDKNYRLILTLMAANGKLQKARKRYESYRVPVEKYKTAEELFRALMYSCTELNEGMVAHMICLEVSSFWNMTIMSTLGKARGEINEDVYRDTSLLLSKISEVESADVPAAMQNLAFHIAIDAGAEKFKLMNIEEATEWLKSTPCTAGVKFRQFLAKHGHRCLKEFDMRTLTWGADPKNLVKLLQNLVGNVSDEAAAKKIEDYGKVIAGLNLPLGFFSRNLLRFFLLPQSRRAVQNRETSKSILIKSIDCWRKAYWHLGHLMVKEGRIPDVDLLFFMTFEDIDELLRTRSPKILSKANHRRRRYPEIDRYIFPEIMKGFPRPVNVYNTPIIPAEDNFMMKGIPVSQGVTEGYVRVAFTLEEAAELKPGEILLTYSTDIGWTPYFPTLAGVVTELGGLISHGAVVSREYGLPCIAGLHGATRQFQTGDYVLLDGNKGILQKLRRPDQDIEIFRSRRSSSVISLT